jgi:maltose O-acetyltransferase
MIDASGSGSNCIISPFCYTTDHDRGTPYILKEAEQKLINKPVVIGNSVWLGAGAVVLKGVTIDDGAVFGANAVVSRDVGNHETVTGVPARRICRPSE